MPILKLPPDFSVSLPSATEILLRSSIDSSLPDWCALLVLPWRRAHLSRLVYVDIHQRRNCLADAGDSLGPNLLVSLYAERPQGRQAAQTAQRRVRNPPTEFQISEFLHASKLVQMFAGGAGYTPEVQNLQFG